MKSTKMATKVLRGKREDVDPYNISSIGWAELEPKFRELMGLMDAPAPGLNTLQARATHRAHVSSIITRLVDRAQEESRRLLVEGSVEAAVEGGLKCLRLREEFFGKRAMELVPAYLHLARCNQYLRRYSAAEEMVSLAQWIVVNREKDASLAVKAELYQVLGLLYAAESKFDAAIEQLTVASYYLSLTHGADHVLTTFAYFDLGNVFASKGMMENAMVLYDTIKDIWKAFLEEKLQEMLRERERKKLENLGYEEVAAAMESDVDHFASARQFGRDNLLDASKMLSGILNLQIGRCGASHPSPGHASLILGLLYLWGSDPQNALPFLADSRDTLQKFYGAQHPTVEQICWWASEFGIPLDEVPEASQ